MERAQNTVADFDRVVMSDDAVEDQTQECKIGIGIVESLARRKIGRLVIGTFQTAQRRPVASWIQDKGIELVLEAFCVIVDPAGMPD